MGGDISLQKEIKVHQCAVIKKINLLHIHAIKKAYYDIKAYKISTSFIDRNRFVQCLDLDENVTDKLFSAFDIDGNGFINWRECLAGLSLCVTGSLREKSTALFKLFKVSSERGITPSALQNLLTVSVDAALRIYNCDTTNGNGCGVLLLNTDAIVGDIVREIYKSTEYTQEGKLYLSGFQKFVEQNSKIPSTLFKYNEIRSHKKEELSPSKDVDTDSVLELTLTKSTVLTNKGAEKLSPTSPTVQTYIWTNTFPERVRNPSMRNKHAACLHGCHLYLYGGRDVNTTLKDLWKFDINSSVWTLLKCCGDVPPALQEHSMVPYKDDIYIFGGEFGFGSCDETPLWIFDVEKKHWRKHSVDSEVRMPSSRRGHSAVVHNGAMHIYGGYVDLKGSTNEFWSYDFESNAWHLNYSCQVDNMPSARHCHVAMVHDNAMWIHGGLANLTAKGDIWKWSFETRKWSRIRYRQGPGDLHGHSVVKVTDAMLIFGGEDSDGNVRHDLWKFYFDSHTWQKIVCHNHISPTPRTRHVAVAVATQVCQSPKSPRAHSVPNLRNRNKPSMAAIVEESVETLQRPYSSPPAFQCQDVHHFKTRVHPAASPHDQIHLESDEGYQNASFVDDRGSNCALRRDATADGESVNSSMNALSDAVDDKTTLIDLEQPSHDANPVQFDDATKRSSSSVSCAKSTEPFSRTSDAVSTVGGDLTQCNIAVAALLRTDVPTGDCTYQTKHRSFAKRSPKPENIPLPGLVKEDGDKLEFGNAIVPNVTEIDESDKVDVSDRIRLLTSDSEPAGLILSADRLCIGPNQTAGTSHLNSWTDGLSENSVQSDAGSLVDTPNNQPSVRTEDVMKYSHNAASSGEPARPKLHGRSRTLSHVPISSDTIQNAQERRSMRRTDHFIVAKKEDEKEGETTETDFNHEVSMFYLLGGKEQDTNILDQYTMPMDVWRCDIMTGKPTSQQIQKLMAERHG